MQHLLTFEGICMWAELVTIYFLLRLTCLLAVYVRPYETKVISKQCTPFLYVQECGSDDTVDLPLREDIKDNLREGIHTD